MANDYRFTMGKVWLHLKTILIHKHWVLHYAIMCGIPWQGFTHDLSKFSPTEFLTNVRYTRKGISPIDVQKKEIGFSKAWIHHRNHNPHHYEYWMDRFDDGCYVTRMPDKYIIECLCDFLAANKAYNGKLASYGGQFAWWEKQRTIRNMHPDDIEFLDIVLKACKDDELNGEPVDHVLNKEYLRMVRNVVLMKSKNDLQVLIKRK